MIEYNKVASGNDEVFENDRIGTVHNDGKFSLTQLWEVILRNKRLPGKQNLRFFVIAIFHESFMMILN